MAKQRQQKNAKTASKTTAKEAAAAPSKEAPAAPPALPAAKMDGINKTGIVEIDEALNGGIPTGSCVLLAGGSGVGKTILAMQWMFNGFKKYGEPAIYITTTEPVFKSINNMRKFSFFDQSIINPMQVHMTDLRGIMKDLSIDYTKDAMSWQDVENILSVIKNLVVGMGAKRLVVDSVTAICYHLRDETLIRTFIFRLGTMLSNLDCTTILTSEVTSKEKAYSPFGIEEFISDGIFKLEYIPRGDSFTRALRIVKMRGTDFDPSPLYYTITKDGHSYLAKVNLEEVKKLPDTRVKTGVIGLDEMLMGGIFQNTTTLVTGSSGTGKSMLGVQFLYEGTTKRQKGLLLSYEESKAQIFKNGKAAPGVDLEKLEKAGLIKVVCHFPEDLTYEEHLQLVRREVEDFKPERVVIDSISSLEKIFTEENLLEYTRRVNFFLKRMGCTNLLINSSEGIFETSAITRGHLSTIPDNIIMLKYVEIESAMKRFITVLKIRGSDHDKQLREYIIDKEGINVKEAFKNIQGVLSGNVRQQLGQEEMMKAFKDLAKG